MQTQPWGIVNARYPGHLVRLARSTRKIQLFKYLLFVLGATIPFSVIQDGGLYSTTTITTKRHSTVGQS